MYMVYHILHIVFFMEDESHELPGLEAAIVSQDETELIFMLKKCTV